MSNGIRIGVFGSSFNPPTLAHYKMIVKSHNKFQFDRILLMFTTNNPDKAFSTGGTTISQRLDMMNLMATQIEKELMVSTSIHITSHGLVFNQAQELRMKYPNSEFYFIMGNDTFSRFINEKYYVNYDFKQEMTRLFQSSHLVNFPRNDSLLTYHDLSPFIERINTLEFSNSISSSQIRHAIQAGGDASKLLLPSIMEYIQVNKLYM